ncbi:type I polyketide synthase [Actinomadura sp. WMMB 499]|uniref:type I polyketide synthase n=1 Tax=Actinomadura sp. WMMB 499 TaxID=1219491 RepID=UPI001C3FEBE3|nr:type I polyketide synthase [Actinomadura sp. WMMB 499]
MDDEIAIIGLACRFPASPDPDAFWRLLADGVDAVGEAPAGRRPADDLADPGTRYGAFLDHIDRFDAAFFDISPREAAAMDPQQRLMLELAWESLEDAGIVPAVLRGDRVGVFAGAIWDDYAAHAAARGPAAITRHSMTGLNRGMIANRVSYTLGFTGPSLTVDTGQSSSLVAVHLACESLRKGESTLALAGGVSLIVDGSGAVRASRFGGLSPDGRCRTFDARANGFVRGEGGGVALLKPLARALADGDPVYGVIRGSAVNHDGPGEGLTVPSADAQRDVIGAARERAGVVPAQVQYVELHGTGTPVGDPVEAAALGAALGHYRSPSAPLRVGSVKTNIGHLEGAAGIAGLLKVALALKHRRLPASLHFRAPGPAVPLDELRLRVQDETGPWPAEDRPLIAGVSSFGMGGTNCHVVLEQAPPVPSPAAPVPSPPAVPPVVPLVVSGRDAEALRGQALRLLERLRADPDADPAEIGRALVTTRSTFEHRAVVTGTRRRDLKAGLKALAEGRSRANVVSGGPAAGGGTAFMFGGQGGQRPGMGAGLYDAFEVFRDAIDEMFALFDPLLDRPLRDVMFGTDAEALDGTAYTQPALFAYEVALYRFVASCGVVPGHLLGHSIGEIAAAHVAGVLSLPDACTMVAARGRAMQALPATGAMAALEASEAEAAELLAADGRAEVAAVNGPRAVVISGDRDAVLDAAARWRERGRKANRLRVSHAFHSAHMEPMLDDFRAVVGGLTLHAPRMLLVSNLTGRLATAGELRDPGYWVEHVRRAVRFADGVRHLHDLGVTDFVEIGPDAVLTGMAAETLSGHRDTGVIPSARRNRPEAETVVSALARAHIRRGSVDWAAVYPGWSSPTGPRTKLPTYAFQRSGYWLDAPADAPPPAPAVPGPQEGEPPATPAAAPAPLSGADGEEAFLDAVRTAAALVLGHDEPDAIDTSRTFKQLGFDSLAAVEFRDRLGAATGRALPASLAFDHPTPVRLARHLHAGATNKRDGTATPRTRVAVEEPIAIVGMGCRYPGGVESPEDLWTLVSDERDAIGPFPDNRGWDLDALFDPDPDHPGTSYAREGGFLHDADRFDASFFGISPREAIAMDPQQRLLLEVAWETLERAGIDPATLENTPTGVFVGAMSQDYGPRQHEAAEGHAGYALTGTTNSVASGRIAYALGLRGAALTVDTACSSSLVALHLAAQALRSGESDLALAGGVAIMATPGMFVEFSRQRGLAADGRCKPFSSTADGTGWSEGAGLLLLERLSDARRNGHRILALIEGSAVNQDGASNGLTAPNGPSQEDVIGAALAAAGLRPDQIDAVEAHGTGTALGDPIEANALLAAYGQNRPEDRPLRLGSIKSNIGHTQAAAGVAGVIKMVQALQHRRLPRTLHVDQPSPHVDWTSGAVSLLTEARDWPTASDRPRRAAVSSFGISGTNAHLLLQESPATDARETSAPEEGPGVLPWVLSARSEAALRQQARRLHTWLNEHPDAVPADVGHTLATGRTRLEHRAVITGTTTDDFRTALQALADNHDAPNLTVGSAPKTAGKTVFVFPGQGSQWAAMANSLLETSPIFRDHITACHTALAPHTDWSLLALLRNEPDAPSLERTDVVQPALFSVMTGLAALWQAHGVHPDAVIGHSQGEIAAAYTAGALTLHDAAAIIAERSKTLAQHTAPGAMASVALPAEQLGSLPCWNDQLHIAAVNGPTTTVVSGTPDAIDTLLAHCDNVNLHARRILVDYASHSPAVEALKEHLIAPLTGIAPQTASTAFYSTVTGRTLDTRELDGEYWYRNLREPVLLHPTVNALLDDGHTTFIEVSPHPVLTPAIQQTLEPHPDAHTSGTLRRDHGGLEQFLTATAQAHTHGTHITWPFPTTARTTELPTYPFERDTYWMEAPAPTADVAESLGLSTTGHPFLGAATEVPDSNALLFSGRLSLRAHPWLADHAVNGNVLLPGTALVDLALHTGAHAGTPYVEDLTLETPLPLPGEGGVDLRIVLAPPGDDGRRTISVHSRVSDEPWIGHATGTLAPEPANATDEPSADAPSGPFPSTSPGCTRSWPIAVTTMARSSRE